MKRIRFKRLVHQHQDSVFSFAFYLTGHRQDAEDVTQEALLRLWKHMDSVKGQSARPWLMRVTRNLCIDIARSRRHTRDGVESLDEHPERDLPSPDDAPNPHDQAEQGELRELLLDEIRRLPETQRDVVLMREIEEMKYEEIAEALDLPLNSVKAYLHRGRRRLRETLCDVLQPQTATGDKK